MKTIKFMMAAVFAIFMGIQSYAQMQDHSGIISTKTETFKVYGNCGSCKARIEKAALQKGVSKAEWNKDTKVLTVVYNPSQISSETILKKIALNGHDNEKFKADNKTYNALPGCCQYEREK